MRSYIQWLRKNVKSLNIIYIDFADLKYEGLKSYKSLYDYIEEAYLKETLNVVMVDEVQLCKQFELAINSLYNSRKYDIYLTGSNAFLLSSDLSTLFTGRFIEIPIFPFSLSEYCTYYNFKRTDTQILQNYLVEGGLAGAYIYRDKEDQVS